MALFDEMDIYKIIVKSLIGKVDKPEEEYFVNWLGSHPDNRNFYEQLKKYWEFNGHSIEEKKKEVWSKIHDQIGLTNEIKLDNSKTPKTLPLKRVYWAAASVLLILSSVFMYTQLEQEPQIAVVSTGVVEKSAAPGHNLTVRLPDGTQVKLNAESTLSYPEVFSNSKREVRLIGEAFFEVEKDLTKPFIIHSADIQTTVKGTSFNIKAYPENSTIEVAVETGLVEVKKRNEDISQILLNKHEAVVYDKKSNVLKLHSFSKDMISWKDGVINFDKASFEEIVVLLERWYGVEIDIRKKVNMGKGFVGRYENQSLKAVIESISYAGDFSYEIKNKILIVY